MSKIFMFNFKICLGVKHHGRMKISTTIQIFEIEITSEITLGYFFCTLRRFTLRNGGKCQVMYNITLYCT